MASGLPKWLLDPNAIAPEDAMGATSAPVAFTPSPTVAGAPRPGAPAVPASAQPRPPSSASIPMIEHTQTSESFLRDDPAAVKKADAARASYEASILQGAEQGAKKAEELRAEREATARMLAQENAEAARKEAEFQARVDEAEREQRQAVDELAQMKVDPGGLWKEQGDGAAVVAALAIALDNLRRGFFRDNGPNNPQQIVNAAIQRNLNKQESEIAIQRDKVNAKGNMLARLTARIGDQRQARSVMRQGLLEQAAARFEAKAAALPEEVRQKANEFAAKLRLDAEQEQKNRSAHTVTIAKSKQPAFSAADLGKMSEDERARFVPDAGGLALTPDDAKIMKAYAANVNRIMGDIEKLQGMVSQYGNESLPTTARAKMVQLRNRIITEMKEEAKLGAMSDSDRDLVEAQLADVTKFFGRGSTSAELLGELRGTFASAKLQTYRDYGLAQ